VPLMVLRAMQAAGSAATISIGRYFHSRSMIWILTSS
jgi:hypothetical protein